MIEYGLQAKRQVSSISVRLALAEVNHASSLLFITSGCIDLIFYLRMTGIIGYLHGAYYEGEMAGNHIATCIQTGVCDKLPRFDEVLNAAPYDISALD
jgi:hypothetical protein